MSEESGFKAYENAKTASCQIKAQIFLMHFIARLQMKSVLTEMAVIGCKRNRIARQCNERLLNDLFERPRLLRVLSCRLELNKIAR